MAVHMLYIPALLLGTGSGINIIRYNTVLDSTTYIKIMVPNTLLGSKVCVKNTVFGSTSLAINKYLLI